jgi:predicted NBD/HSP70 family sugar kinase
MIARRTLTGSSSSTIKTHNLRAVLLTLLRHPLVSRAGIAELTGLSTTTVTNLITGLLDQGVVIEDGMQQPVEPRGVGRPRTALRLVPEARHAIGIHIGVGRVYVAVTDLFARPLHDPLGFDHPLERSADEVLSEVAGLIKQAVRQSRVDPQAIVGVGVGASGLVNSQTGVNVLAPNLGWHEIPIQSWFESHLHLPVFVDNNVRAMALAEALFGAGQDVDVLAFVYVRIGVGAGFVIGGQLFRGRAGAGEIGHMLIEPDSGERCRCGNTGCLETLVSEPALIEQARQIATQSPGGPLAERLRAPGRSPVEQIFAAARAGDEPTRLMLAERARYMGIGLANLVNTLSPELIILGGIFAQGEDVLFPVTQETLRCCAFANMGANVRLQTPTFGPNEGVIGAAALALNAFFYEQSEDVF